MISNFESMRREGFELGVSRPEVIQKEVDGELQEPYEQLVVDCEEQHQGSIMEELGLRRAELENMVPDGKGHVVLTHIAQNAVPIQRRSERFKVIHAYDEEGAYVNLAQELDGRTGVQLMIRKLEP